MGEERAVNLEHTRSCGAWHWDEPCTCALKERIELASALERIRELEAILVSPGKVEGWPSEEAIAKAIATTRGNGPWATWIPAAKAIRKLPSPTHQLLEQKIQHEKGTARVHCR